MQVSYGVFLAECAYRFRVCTHKISSPVFVGNTHEVRAINDHGQAEECNADAIAWDIFRGILGKNGVDGDNAADCGPNLST